MIAHCIFYSDKSSNVTLPEWLTGSPANMQIKRLGFARECSNRSGDDLFGNFVPPPNPTAFVYANFNNACACNRP